jgi:hypothetical protein
MPAVRAATSASILAFYAIAHRIAPFIFPFTAHDP